MLRSAPQSVDVRCFRYLKYLQTSAVGTLFESAVKSLIRQTFIIIIGAVSKDLDVPPENRTGDARTESTLEGLLDVWGKDGLEDPESSTVCLRYILKSDSSHIPCPASPYIHGRKVATGRTLWPTSGVHVPRTPSRTAGELLLAPGSQCRCLPHHRRSVGLVGQIQRDESAAIPSAF